MKAFHYDITYRPFFVDFFFSLKISTKFHLTLTNSVNFLRGINKKFYFIVIPYSRWTLIPISYTILQIYFPLLHVLQSLYTTIDFQIKLSAIA